MLKYCWLFYLEEEMSKKRLIFPFFLFFLFASRQSLGEIKMEARVYFERAEELLSKLGDFFSELDVATGGETELGESYLIIITTEGQLKEIRERGLRVEITYPDIREKFRIVTGIDPDKRELLRDFGYFFTYWEMVDTLTQLKRNYPEICTLMNIGNSYQGRPLWTLKISDNPRVDESEPAVYINGAIHAREPGATHCCIDFASYLLSNYGQDSSITWLINNREIFITPVQNPDGYVYNSDSAGPDANWRKNRRVIQSPYVGVDLNRNFGYRWGYDNQGSSPNPSSETYRGPSRFSEFETQTIRDFMLPQKIRTQLDYHTYGRYNMFPWGYSSRVWPPDTAVLREVVDTFRMYNGYPQQRTGQLSRVLYAANGVSVDWEYADTFHLGVRKFVTYALTIEWGINDFWYGWSDSLYIHNECRLNRPNNLYLTKVAGVFFEPRGVFINDSLRGNRTLQLDPGETASVWFRVRNRAIHPLDSAYSVIGKLKSLDTMVIVLESIRPFPNCRRRSDTTNRNQQFRVYCRSSAEPGRVVPLRLELGYLDDGLSMSQPVNFSTTIGSNPIVSQDVGVIAITSPSGMVDSGNNIIPACTVYNYGNSTEDYAVRMKIGTFYDQITTVSNHQPLAKLYLTFPQWRAERIGTHLVSCSTRLSGDMVLTNDRKTCSVEVRRLGMRDVGCTKIIAPIGIVDSGAVITPACSLYNYGTTTETYLVKMKIGAITLTANVNGHQPLTYQYLTFPDWLALTRGNLMVVCTTELNGDAHPENDRQRDSVFVSISDVGITAILAPSGVVDSGSVITPQVKVKNFGNTNVSFNTVFMIGEYLSERVVSELLPNEEREVNFGEWLARPRGFSVVRCTTQLPNDKNNENDQKIDSVFVRVRDIGVVAILAPQDTLDSGIAIIPKVVIKNFGTEPAEFFDVAFSIDDYQSIRGVSRFEPDGETILEFDLWRGERIGEYTAKCTTRYSDDQQNGNDFLTKTFIVRGGPPGAWVKLFVEVPTTPPSAPKRIKSGGGLIAGTDKIFIMKGNNTKDFYEFVPESFLIWIDSLWGSKRVKKGAAMAYDGERYLYYTIGNNTKEFWRYDTKREDDSIFVKLADVLGDKALKGGTGMAYLPGFVYLLKGSKTKEFYRYKIEDGTWETLPDVPEGSYPGKGYPDGSCLVALGTEIYALRGKYNEFYKYDGTSWSTESLMPFYHPMWNKKKKVGEGAGMTVKDGKIYAFKGNNTKEFWMYDPSLQKWTGLETIPKGIERKYVKGGGGLCLFNNTIYALKGNNTTVIYKYTGTDIPTPFLPNLGTQGYAPGMRNAEWEMRITPNPAKGQINVNYNLPTKETATLKIYNVLGEIVYSAKGNKGTFTGKKLPTGIYILRLETGGYKKEKKLVVVE